MKSLRALAAGLAVLTLSGPARAFEPANDCEALALLHGFVEQAQHACQGAARSPFAGGVARCLAANRSAGPRLTAAAEHGRRIFDDGAAGGPLCREVREHVPELLSLRP